MTRVKNTISVLTLLMFIILVSGCVTTPPRNLDNVCSIFKEKRGWYKAAKKSEQKWGSSIATAMAIIHQESRFKGKAKPPRKKFLWVIPGPRISSAYGYPQAKKETWRWYIRETGNGGADRDSFKDAVDFIGWYNRQSLKQNQIALNDTYSLYLAFHEGHGGFSRKTYNQKEWLRGVAARVSSRSNRYASQLKSCEADLEDSWWWPF